METSNVLLGVELHIRNHLSEKPYHGHVYFSLPEITSERIDSINILLDTLYPNKIVSKDSDVPTIMDIINTFDEHDFLLLPHGGQSHNTFDKSIPEGVNFDKTLERTIYYNLFDGFTARSNIGLEKTIKYFKRLGISEFVNLMTSSDNYNPVTYPKANDTEAPAFVPTWMYAMPTFNGLRISLSEKSRFEYGEKPSPNWSKHINKVTLRDENININVELTPGLNVIIGDSSSGKTLFVDSVFRKITDDFHESIYSDFGVENINVSNPSGLTPHYIDQNYINEVLSDKEKNINDIEIIRKVFPSNTRVDEKIRLELSKLKSDIGTLFENIIIIEQCESDFSKIPFFSQLIFDNKLKKNIIAMFIPTHKLINSFKYTEASYNKHKASLKEIRKFISTNPFLKNQDDEISKIQESLDFASNLFSFEESVRSIILKHKKAIDELLNAEDRELQEKSKQYNRLIELVSNYTIALSNFDEILERILDYRIEDTTKDIEIKGHKLSIQNKFVLNKEKVKNVINAYLKTPITSINELKPYHLYKKEHKQRPKVKDYADFENKIYSDFESLNKINYKIITNKGKDFNKISPGWKTSVLIDLVLGYDEDIAPIIIDQPEDNLAPYYINHDLIKSIKKVKKKKQVILVSHNATIPMLGDAQNIVLCHNVEGKISIISKSLEDSLDGKSIVDFIADLTDGGKSSIKKRVKKYNLKSFRSEQNES